MIKRWFGVVLVLCLCLGLVGCGGSTTGDGTPKDNQIAEMQVGVPFERKTDYGDYTLTINGATRTQTRLGLDKDADFVEVVNLDYEYTNITYKPEDTTLEVSNQAFTVVDDAGNILRPYGMCEGGLSPQKAPPGTTCTVKMAYGLTQASQNLKVFFITMSGDTIAEITIPITD